MILIGLRPARPPQTPVGKARSHRRHAALSPTHLICADGGGDGWSATRSCRPSVCAPRGTSPDAGAALEPPKAKRRGQRMRVFVWA